jgi:simple sugar transport system permease protein
LYDATSKFGLKKVGNVLMNASTKKASVITGKNRNLSRILIKIWHAFRGSILIPLLAVFCALGVGAIILEVAGFNPINAYGLMWQGMFGSVRNISEVLVKATPLIFTGIAVAVAYSGGVWNIGAEGQFILGAIGATVVGLYGGSLPSFLLIPLVLLAGFVAGGLWALIPGLLKAWIDTNEVVVTIMLNYIAIGITSLLVTGPLQEARGYYPQTELISKAAMLPRILPGTRLHIGFLIAIALAIIMTIILFRTPLGFSIRTIGHSLGAARFAGIPVNRTIVMAMLLSGGAAGLGGAVEITGLTGRLFATISSGYGFDGIAVSLLVNNNPIGTILSGFLFGGLRAGSDLMQMNAGIPSVLIEIIQGLTVAFVIGFSAYQILRAKWQVKTKEKILEGVK